MTQKREGGRAVERRREHRLLEMMKGRAAEVADLVKKGARTVAEQAVEKAGEAAKVVKDEADRVIDDQKGRTASRVGSVGSAIHQAARVLRAGRIEKVADYAEAAAEEVDEVTRYLRGRDMQEMIADATTVVRRYPVAFLGGMLVAGLALARFVKAGQPEESGEASGREEGGGRQGTGGSKQGGRRTVRRAGGAAAPAQGGRRGQQRRLRPRGTLPFGNTPLTA